MTRARDLADSADKDISGTLTLDDIVLSNDMTVADNGKVIFGAGSDLQIFHDGSHSYISDQGTGHLKVFAESFYLNNAGDTEQMIGATVNGAVDLFYNGSKKLETTSDGVTVTGDLEVTSGTNAQITINDNVGEVGSGNLALQVTNSAGSALKPMGFRAEDIRFATGSSERMRINSDGQIGLGTTDPRHILDIEASTTGAIPTNADMGASNENDNFFSFHNSSNSATFSGLALETRTSGASKWLIANEWQNTYLGDLVFRVRDGGTSSSEVLRINSSGSVGIGTSSPTSYGNSQATLVVEDSSNPAIALSDTGQARDWFLVALGDGLGIRYADGGGSGSASNLIQSAFFKNDGNLGIGTSDPHDAGDNFSMLTLNGPKGGGIVFSDDDVNQHQIYTTDDASLRFARGSSLSSETMRLEADGDVLIGKTSSSALIDGHYFTAAGFASHCRTSNYALTVTRNTDDGANINIIGRQTQAGYIGSDKDGSNSCIYIANGDIGWLFNAQYNAVYPYNHNTGSLSDDLMDIGYNSARLDDIYATNGTIQTSDQREKQQIASLTSAEITAATAISKLFKTFKWNSAVEEKGDAARTHAGVIAQEVETAMSNAGLDAGDYAFFISTTWWEAQEEVAAVEADEENDIEAQEAYTRTKTYRTQEDAPEGATEHNRKGIRYPELLSFLGAATEQRLTSIESRLDALEAN